MTISHWAYDHAARLGDYDALIDGRSVWTASELLDQAARVATGLIDLGVAPGDRVVLLLPFGREALVASDAVWRCGAVAVFAATGMPGPELSRLIALARPAAIVAQAGEPVGNESGALTIVAGEPHVPPGAVAFEALIATHRALPAPVPRDVTDLAQLIVSSGTSGLPKLVEITHGALEAMMRQRQAAIGDDVARQQHTVLHMLAPASFGGQHMLARFVRKTRLVALRKFDPAAALELVERYRVNRTVLVPAMAEMMLASPRRETTDVSSLRDILISGDHVSLALSAAIDKAFGSFPHVTYGMSELGGGIAGCRSERQEGSVGHLLPGVEVQIVDPEGRVLPSGQTGEIRARAPWMARGYWRDPEQTARVFRDNWVSTGDLGRLGSDGELFLLGRSKRVVIRGGYNIAPQEVVEVLVRIPGVHEAAAVGVRSEGLGQELVACIVPRPGAAPTAEDVMTRCRAELDSRKLPGRIVFRPSLPRTRAGKLDVIALVAELEAMETAATGLLHELADAPGPAERAALLESYLCRALADRGIAPEAELDRDTAIGRLGLDSLQLMSLRNLIEHELEVAPDVTTIADGTIGSAAAAIERLRPWRAGRDATAGTVRLDLQPTGVSICPATISQRLFWRLGQVHHHYNVTDIAMLLEGRVDRDLLAQAMTELTRRHSALRTTFDDIDGEVIQRVLPADQVRDCTLEIDDLTALSADDQARCQRERILDYRGRPYDLRIDCGIRGYLLQLAADRHLLVVIAHHIAVDAQACALLAAQLAEIYGALHAGRAVAGPARLQYIDYAEHLRRWSATDDARRQREFWQRTFAGARPLEMPGERDRTALEQARAAAPDGIVGESMFLPASELPAAIHRAVERLSHDERVSPHVVYMAGFVTFLHRASGLDDVCFEETYTPRFEHSALEPMIAMFGYSLIVRVSTPGTLTFRQLIHRTRETFQLAQQHAAALATGDFPPHPLRRVSFNYVPYKASLPLELAPGLTATRQRPQRRPSFRRPWDIQLTVLVHPDRPTNLWLFNERLFTPERARELIQRASDAFALILSPDDRIA